MNDSLIINKIDKIYNSLFILSNNNINYLIIN